MKELIATAVAANICRDFLGLRHDCINQRILCDAKAEINDIMTTLSKMHVACLLRQV
jgi:hypothetical protein